MKSGKRPNKKQKIFISQHGLNPDNWLIVKNLDSEMHVIHREVGQVKVLQK
ncbi:hypothetical protein M670_00165 [Schinkia azotoformans MEV2011]|uniref:DUF6906 domain-containing protein n=1 Tax=Schinkia azotoformans MEV2011 TaxID=1348973 RepID=A0A072NR65_SCHAZ|nr:hypothetical protein [Schinkia azotoformans]KEF40149.1 hypothetical protein M670_00165 [Schinkia azotoformans MEV2011]